MFSAIALRRHMLGGCLMLALLGGCSRATIAVTPTPEPIAAPSPPIAEPIPTAAPPTRPLQPPAPSGVGLLPVYLYEGQVYTYDDQGEPMVLADVADDALDAQLLDGETLLVARPHSLERVDLETEATAKLLSSQEQIYGFDAISVDEERWMYRIMVDVPNVGSGSGTRIGTYNLATGEIKELIAEPYNLELLGLTADHSGILLLPRGQDPGYGSIEIRSIEDGRQLERLDTPGEGFMETSPDGRWAVGSFRQALPDQTMEKRLVLYDLSQRPLASFNVPLPNPGAATGGAWSPDSSQFFFSYVEGDMYTPTGSYGLWWLAPETLVVNQLSDIDVRGAPLVSASLEGGVLLHQGDTATLVHGITGDTINRPMPAGAVFVGWKWGPL